MTLSLQSRSPDPELKSRPPQEEQQGVSGDTGICVGTVQDGVSGGTVQDGGE